MQRLPMDRLGPRTSGSQVHFGIFLPGIDPAASHAMAVRVIHEDDQFIQNELPFDCAMQHSVDPVWGDYWEATVDLGAAGKGAHWGQPGRYIYRYLASTPGRKPLDWIIDPFAREFGIGRHAAFTYGYGEYPWSQREQTWQVPAAADLLMYELNVMEFGGSLERVAERFGYLNDLGVNCLSLMPITNVCEAIDWGYTPVGYFGVDERFGKRYNFRRFVDLAHEAGLAVLVDAIYGHTSPLFGYEYLYSQLGVPNPVMGSFSNDQFGPSVDWAKSYAQDFFFTCSLFWLEKYRVDGFRYDCVPNYWELFPHYRGFASIAYHTYQHVNQRVAAGDPDYRRFAGGAGPLRLIQCAEQLEDVKGVLEQTYATCTWQNGTLDAAQRVAKRQPGSLVDLGFRLGADGLPSEVVNAGDVLPKAPLQYIETHDQNRFVCNFGVVNNDESRNPLFDQGRRDRWYEVQPYLIGVLMGKGIPLLWQGEELCQNQTVAASSSSRVSFLRPVQWEYFYDEPGRGTIGLVRRLLRIRKDNDHIRSGEHFFFHHDERYHHKGVLLFARYFPNTSRYTLVALNFTDTDQTVPFWFPLGGGYREELHGTDQPGPNLVGVTAYAQRDLLVPSHYGRIWTHV